MGRRKSQADWLLEKIRFLSECGEKFGNDGPTIEYGPHTLLKLISAMYYGEMFATIARGDSARSRGYDAAIYVDLFAGPGLITIKNTGDVVAGSPIAVISAALEKTPFDYSILVEKNPGRSSALQNRLTSMLSTDEFTVVNGDCNDEIRSVIRSISKQWEKPIILAFVDPEGMEAKWKTIGVLSQAFPNVDFMINLTAGVSRVAGKLAAGQSEYKPIFEDFFGSDADTILVKASQGEPISEQYEQGIKVVLGKPMGATIPVKDEHGRIVYQILAYTRLSLTGSPWAVGFKTLQGRLANIDGSLALQALNVVKGRQKTLESLF